MSTLLNGGFVLLILTAIVFFFVAIARIAQYCLFQDKNGKNYAQGTFREAKRVVDTTIKDPDFTWLSDLLGGIPGVYPTYIGQYDIQYKNVSMKLGYFDYRRYLKYLTEVYKDRYHIENHQVNPTWRDLID